MENIDLSIYNSVIVIGNGFDINLGLPTKYTEFIKGQEFNKLLKNNNKLAEYLGAKTELQKWIDIENELKYYSSHKTSDNFRNEFNLLCRALTSYINSINYNILDRKSTAYALIQEITNDDSTVILDFNYTQSTKYILRNFGNYSYDINNRLLKVHGEASENNIIFGVEDKASIKKEDVFLRKAYNKEYKALNFSKLFEHVDKLTFFGHSLGETDHTYFEKLFLGCISPLANMSNKEFTFYHYGEEGYDGLMKQIDSLTGNNLTIFKQYNNVRFIDTYSQSK